MNVQKAKISPEQVQQFKTDGYVILKGLFSPSEVEEIEQIFEKLSHQTFPDFFEPDLQSDGTDPLKRYPRFIHPHRFNNIAKKYMLHQPVMDVLVALYEEEPLAVQSMYYFKPPGAKGQALHQDNFYLMVEPGNCIAAWTAIDPADEENGGMLIVPKTQDFEIACPEEADNNESFTTHLVKPPKDRQALPAIMDRGDVLFFNGNLIHGSYRNKSKNRFRRAFICHYANASLTKIADYYRPLYRVDGTVIDKEANASGGPCGVEFANVYAH